MQQQFRTPTRSSCSNFNTLHKRSVSFHTDNSEDVLDSLVFSKPIYYISPDISVTSSKEFKEPAKKESPDQSLSSSTSTPLRRSMTLVTKGEKPPSKQNLNNSGSSKKKNPLKGKYKKEKELKNIVKETPTRCSSKKIKPPKGMDQFKHQQLLIAIDILIQKQKGKDGSKALGRRKSCYCNCCGGLSSKENRLNYSILKIEQKTENIGPSLKLEKGEHSRNISSSTNLKIESLTGLDIIKENRRKSPVQKPGTTGHLVSRISPQSKTESLQAETENRAYQRMNTIKQSDFESIKRPPPQIDMKEHQLSSPLPSLKTRTNNRVLIRSKTQIKERQEEKKNNIDNPSKSFFRFNMKLSQNPPQTFKLREMLNSDFSNKMLLTNNQHSQTMKNLKGVAGRRTLGKSLSSSQVLVISDFATYKKTRDLSLGKEKSNKKSDVLCVGELNVSPLNRRRLVSKGLPEEIIKIKRESNYLKPRNLSEKALSLNTENWSRMDKLPHVRAGSIARQRLKDSRLSNGQSSNTGLERLTNLWKSTHEFSKGESEVENLSSTIRLAQRAFDRSMMRRQKL